jgi:hypothetical protein
MHVRRHPLSRALYNVGTDGLVYVDDHGVTGVFTPDGDWVSGDLRHADAHLCGWLAGRQPNGKGMNPKDLPGSTGIRDLASIARDNADRKGA